ncbi:hypothetical protein B7463_g4807, partial [Scytalidium lignicola]
MADQETSNSTVAMEIANTLLQKHHGATAPPIEDAIAHAMYLYQLPGSIQAHLDLTNLWMYDEEGKATKGEDLYVRHQILGNESYKYYRFLSPKYTAIQSSKHDDELDFIPWLVQNTKLSITMPINKGGRLESFANNSLIYIPTSEGHSWVLPKDCAWGGPQTYIRNIKPYFEDEPSLCYLFSSVLDIKPPTLDDLVQYLEYIKKTVYTKPPTESIYSEIFEKKELVCILESDEHIFWCKPSDCFWDGIFLNFINSDSIHYYDPTDIAAKRFLQQTLNIHDMKPDQGIRKLQLLEKRGSVSKDQMNGFFVPDNGYFQKLFCGKLPMLELNIKQVTQFHPVFQKLGLQERYLSKSVKQTLSTSGISVEDISLTSEMRYRAQALVCYVKYLDSKSSTGRLSKVKQLLDTMKVYRATNIYITYSVNFMGYKESVQVPETLFFCEKFGCIHLFVPADDIGQREAFATRLPKEIIQFIGLPESESWQIVTSLLNVKIDRVKTILDRFEIQNFLPDFTFNLPLDPEKGQAKNKWFEDKFETTTSNVKDPNSPSASKPQEKSEGQRNTDTSNNIPMFQASRNADMGT